MTSQQKNDILLITQRLQKKIHVHSYQLSKEGIVIVYDFEGKTYHFMAEPERAAEVLKECGIIDRYSMHDEYGLIIAMEVFIERVEYSYDANTLWSDYIQHNPLSQYDAINICVWHEQQKVIQEQTKETTKPLFEAIGEICENYNKSIPDVIFDRNETLIKNTQL